MVSWTVEFDADRFASSKEIEHLFDVNTAGGNQEEVGRVTVVCANTDTNRRIESGDELLVYRNEEIIFRGYVTGKPTKGGADRVELEISAEGKRVELQLSQSNRAFHNVDTGEIVRRLIQEKVKRLDHRYGFSGDSLDNWSADADHFELGNIQSKRLHQYGDDFIFIGWERGASGRKVIRRENVNSNLIEDRSIDMFRTRLTLNGKDDLFDLDIAYRDNRGKQYLWSDIDLAPPGRFTLYELGPEEAGSNARLFDDNTIEYRVDITGTLPEKRAMGIDYSTTVPYKHNDRDIEYSTSGVQSTGRRISRRFNKDVLSIIKELSVEDDYISYIDENDVIHYEPTNNQRSSFEIVQGETPVVQADFNRDYNQIVNEVTVQGSGDISVTKRDQESIEFYGISSRDRDIVDKEIQSRQSAEKRAEGFLSKNAWNDDAIVFTIGDPDFYDVRIGDSMNIEWPNEGISNIYTVSQKNIDRDGFIELSFTQEG